MKFHTKRYAEGLIEAGWLVAAMTTPLFFNPYSGRVFEPDKIALLRSLALIMLGAWALLRLERAGPPTLGATDVKAAFATALKTPLVLPSLIVAGALLVATFGSIAPRLSIFGSFERLQGAYTTGAYLIIFWLLLPGLRSRLQLERLVNVLILTSLPVALYGILQHFQAATATGAADPNAMTSTLGNPRFFAAYLIMVVPLTLSQLLAWREARHGPQPSPARYSGICCHASILLSQITAIIMSQSRGAWLGLCAALLFFTLFWTLSRGQHRLARGVVGLASIYLIFLLAVNLPRSPLAPLRDAPYIGRLTRLFAQDETGEVRLLIWQGDARLVARSPLRAVIGYGPETMRLAYLPFYAPALAHHEGENVLPDRSHNEIWDSLVTTGVVGSAAYLLFITALCYYGLKGLGFLPTPRHARVFLVLWWASGGLVATGASLLAGIGFFGLALALGLLLGLFAYLVWFAFSGQAVAPEANFHPLRPLLIALLAALLGHFIEIQLGIAIATTRLYFWMEAALLVAAGHGLAAGRHLAGAPDNATHAASVGTTAPTSETRGAPGRAQASARPRKKSQQRGATRESAPAPRAAALADTSLSLLCGVLLTVMIFSFYHPLDTTPLPGPLLWLFPITWFAATVMVLGETPLTAQTFAPHLAYSLGYPLLYGLLQQALLTHLPPERLYWGWLWLCLYLGLGLALIARLLGANSPNAQTAPNATPHKLRLLLYPLGALGVGGLIVFTNLRVVTADMLAKQGDASRQQGNYATALTFYNMALARQPAQDAYLQAKARTLYVQAQSSTDGAQRDATFQQAADALQQAAALSPLNADYPTNVARLHDTWSKFAGNAQAVHNHLQQASDAYAAATRLEPNDPSLYHEWGDVCLKLNQRAQALALYQRALALQPDSQLQALTQQLESHSAP